MFDFQLTYTLLPIPLGSPPLTMHRAQDAQPGCDTNIAARRVSVTALTHLKLLPGAEIPSGWNGLLQRELFGHMQTPNLSFNRISASTTVLSHRGVGSRKLAWKARNFMENHTSWPSLSWWHHFVKTIKMLIWGRIGRHVCPIMNGFVF